MRINALPLAAVTSIFVLAYNRAAKDRSG